MTMLQVIQLVFNFVEWKSIDLSAKERAEENLSLRQEKRHEMCVKDEKIWFTCGKIFDTRSLTDRESVKEIGGKNGQETEEKSSVNIKTDDENKRELY
jgi:hypothetical protein